ncbi:Peroxin-3 [Lentinula raphanica]|uniref:Peroxin-3 n=1 Tax=Lentinula raphanica TaxID=153919 RepID=A0AA38UGL0_9AGAR|nr:Peroxin-3 [Lentinula raphanica]KAJ3971682.1 Peroxin-3 [Lentinula raphanica]
MFSYLDSHRNGLKKAAGIAGGLYLIRGYIRARLEEVQEKMEEERLARDHLQRRFEQAHEDVTYTVMALLSDLGEQILEEMDVEAVIRELQSMSSKSSLGGSESMSASISSSVSDTSALSTSGLQGWIDTTGTQAHSQSADSPSEETSSAMSGSFITNISVTESEPGSSSASVVSGASLPSNSNSSESTSSRSKAQLWNSVNILTFTRTLTTIYSISLLTLLTLTQLTILARNNYINAVRHMSAEQDRDAALESELSITLFPSVHDALFAPSDEEDVSGLPPSDLALETLRADYLTLSYYLLHIGWKELSTRIRSAVENVLDGVSLKSRLSKDDVHRLLKDMIRRVTLEGSLHDLMLPGTEDMVRSVLVLGGRDDHDPYPFSEPASSISLHDLLTETRALLASHYLTEVLDSCIEWAVNSLMDSLEAEGQIFAARDDELPRVRLASILPPLASQSRTSILSLPSELVDGILARDETRMFSAWIWARFELET